MPTFLNKLQHQIFHFFFLMTTTGDDLHVPVLLQDDVGVVVEVHDGDGAELGGGAAGFGRRVLAHEVDERLDDGVVGGVHLGVEREGALALAVEGRVTVGRYDPVLPLEVLEGHVQVPPATVGVSGHLEFLCNSRQKSAFLNQQKLNSYQFNSKKSRI